MAKTTTTEKRIFHGGDASMLTSLAVIMGVSTTPTMKTFLLGKRTNWADPFFKTLTDAITATFKDVLGIDPKGGQVKASKELYTAMAEVKPKLSAFKTQVEVDFEDDNREKEILDSLGFSLWEKVQNDNQQALVELLAQFAKNMTPALQTEIVNAGTDVSYITTITSYAAIIRDKNIAQEGKKKDKKTVTNDGIKQLNKVYTDVMKVAKLATAFHIEKGDKLAAEKFSYNKTLATLSSKPGKGGEVKVEEKK